MHSLEYQTWPNMVCAHGSYTMIDKYTSPSWQVLYPKVLEYPSGWLVSLCRYAYLRVSLSGFSTVPDQGSLTTVGELLNISALDPLLPTLLITTLCLCILLTILYYSLVVAWEVFWASWRSPSPLDPSTEVVLTGTDISSIQASPREGLV